jgi:hypothetical protein
MRSTQYATDASIYRLGLPFLPNRIDLAALEQSEQPLLQWLVGGSSARVLQPQGNHKLLHSLLHLYTESKNLEKQLGPNLLGLGWPLVSTLREEGLSVMPVLFWRLTLAPGINNSREWTLRHASYRQPSLNPEYARYLDESGQQDLSQKIRQWLRQPIQSPAQLQQLLQWIDPDMNTAPQVLPCPDMSELPAVPSLHQGGLLGIFPLFPKLRWNQEDLAFALQQTPGAPIPNAHHFGVSVLNPAQASVVESVHQHPQTLVWSPDHSGKTTALAHLLSNFLSNGLRCLVVSDRMGSLSQLQKSLHAAGIQDSDLLLRDPNADRGLMLELLHIKAENLSPEDHPLPNRYKFLIDKCHREQGLLRQAYQAHRQPIFGALNFTELTGKFLESQSLAGRELLASHLHLGALQLDEPSFHFLQKQIATAESLFAEVQTPAHPLRKLHPRIFVEMDASRALPYLEQELARHRLSFEQVQYRLIQEIDQYALRFRQHYAIRTDELQLKIRQLQATLTDYYNHHGAHAQSGSGSLFLKGLFSKQAKETNKDQQHIRELYKSLQQTLQQTEFLNYRLPSTIDFSQETRINEQLKDLEAALNAWKEQVPAFQQEELGRLASGYQHPAWPERASVLALEQELDERLEALNEALLFEEPFRHQMLTLPRRLQFVEQVLEQIELIQLNLRDFSGFFPWQQHWLRLSSDCRKIVQALVRVKPSSWTHAFESWYLHLCLQAFAPVPTPEAEQALSSLGLHVEELKPLLPAQIAHLWSQRQADTLKQLRKGQKNLYEKLFGKNNQQLSANDTFQELFSTGLEPISDFFPVLCCTSSLALQMLPAKPEFFDLVIVLETNRIAPEEASALRLLGKRFCVFANPELGAVSDQTSSTLEALEAFVVNLPRIGQAPSNAILNLEGIDGRFLEQEGHNEAEARHLIGLLNHVQPTPRRTFPSVALIAFTIEQRDLLAGYLLRIKQQGGPTAERIQQLERNGLGVFCIDELHGQEFDIWLVSLCFGSIDLRGTMSRKMSIFDAPAGRKALYLLEKNAAAHTHIVHSLPEEWIAREADIHPLAGLLQRLQQAERTAGQATPWQTPETAPGYFAAKLAKELRQHLPGNNRVELAFHEPGRNPGIWIERPDLPPLLLQPDLFLSGTPFTSFSWEYRERNTLAEHGVQLMPVWSSQWWQHPDRQTHTLVQSLQVSEPENEEQAPPIS